MVLAPGNVPHICIILFFAKAYHYINNLMALEACAPACLVVAYQHAWQK